MFQGGKILARKGKCPLSPPSQINHCSYLTLFLDLSTVQFSVSVKINEAKECGGYHQTLSYQVGPGKGSISV